MRKFGKKRFVAVMTAMTMAATMMGSMSAMAATITIQPQNAERPIHADTEFSLYRIMTVTTDNKGGYAYTVNDTYKTAIEEVLKDIGTTETDVIAYLGQYADDAPEVRLFADKLKAKVKNMQADETITAGDNFSKTVEDGYYLIVDNGAGYVTSLSQLRTAPGTAGDIVIEVKGDYPTLVKKVKEDDLYTDDAGYGAGYNDAADYSIGEDVPFSFDSKVPNMDGYGNGKVYKYTIHDRMESGLTFNEDSVTVKIDGNVLTEGTDYTLVTDKADLKHQDCTFEIVIDDLTKVGTAGELIRVDFTAELNKDAVIGQDGNKNTVNLEYSNSLEDDSTKTTVDDTVVVFTFDWKINKVIKGTATPLAGAKFALYTDELTTNLINLVDLGNSQYRLATPEEVSAAGFTSAAIVSDGINNIVIKGLDSGTYYLSETEAPAGYNRLTAPVELVLTAVYDDGVRQTWDDLDTTTILTKLPDVDQDGNGIVTTVENSAGSILPETGGTGTMVLYILGTVLMAGGVFFLTAKGKKRDDAE